MAAVRRGSLEELLPFTGQSAGLVHEVRSAAEIVDTLVREAEEALEAAGRRLDFLRSHRDSGGNVDAMARMAGTAARAEALLGHGVVSTTPVAGGDICTATRLRLSDGRSAVIKTRPQPPEGFFAREAEGLRWLADAGGANVPELLAVSDDCIVLTWVEPGKPSGDVAERFGRALAATHAAGARAVRRRRRRLHRPGPAAQPAAAHLAGVLRLPPGDALRPRRPWIARRSRHEQAMTIETVMKRIHDFAGDPEPPARVHGDLWSGNVIWGTDGEAWIIDPAAHGGHRETDLAMMALFGLPHLQRVHRCV